MSRNTVGRGLIYTAAGVFGAAWVGCFSFYSIGSQVPDPRSGRTFPVQMHGTLYVEPWEGELFYGALLASAGICAIGFFLDRKGKAT